MIKFNLTIKTENKMLKIIFNKTNQQTPLFKTILNFTHSGHMH